MKTASKSFSAADHVLTLLCASGPCGLDACVLEVRRQYVGPVQSKADVAAVVGGLMDRGLVEEPSDGEFDATPAGYEANELRWNP